jgi:SAM-dependent methyltransferase
LVIDSLLSGLISVGQRTPFRGRGDYSNIPVERQRDLTDLDGAEAEAADFERIFKFFPEDVRSQLANKTVLDFGSGYGGRTVVYAEHCGPNHVSGVEPFQRCVDAGSSFALKRGLGSNVDFSLCTQDHIPYPDATFDCVISFDVLEHVEDPRVSLGELRRVIKPGGKLYAVFPLYRGAFSHHLDYITMPRRVCINRLSWREIWTAL